MKFRTDFVTNSSSSGFVVISITQKDGNTFEYNKDYSSGYGGYFWNGGNFEYAFDSAETGADILHAILENTEESDFIRLDPSYPKLEKYLSSIKSTQDIEKICMHEDTYSDDGESQHWNMCYTVPDLQHFAYTNIEKFKYCFNRDCLLLGEFSHGNKENHYDDIKNLLNSNGWNCLGLYRKIDFWYYGSNLNFDKEFPTVQFLVVGEKTEHAIEAGQIDSITRRALRLLQKYNISVIRENDIFKLGKYTPIVDHTAIPSLQNKLVSMEGDFDHAIKIEEQIHQCGGIPTKAQKVKKPDYVIIGNKSIKHECFNGFWLDQIRKDNIPIFSETSFTEAISSVPNMRNLEPLQPIHCKGHTFITAGMKEQDKTDLAEYITQHGGIFDDGEFKVSKKIDYIIFKKYSPKISQAELLRYQGKSITSISLDRFYDSVKLAETDNAVAADDGAKDLSLSAFVCCLTGDFSFGEKSDVENFIIAHGGSCTSSVTRKTNMLIMGAKGSAAYAHGSYGSKYLKAMQMKDSGADMTILTESDFFNTYKD